MPVNLFVNMNVPLKFENVCVCVPFVCVPVSECQGSWAELIGGIVKGEAPQLDGTSIP